MPKTGTESEQDADAYLVLQDTSFSKSGIEKLVEALKINKTISPRGVGLCNQRGPRTLI